MRATPGSFSTARIALPMRVPRMKRTTPASTTAATPTVMRSSGVRVRSPNGIPFLSVSGTRTVRGSLFQISSSTFCRTM